MYNNKQSIFTSLLLSFCFSILVCSCATSPPNTPETGSLANNCNQNGPTIKVILTHDDTFRNKDLDEFVSNPAKIHSLIQADVSFVISTGIDNASFSLTNEDSKESFELET